MRHIALLKVEVQIPINDQIQPVILPILKNESSDILNVPSANYYAIATGYNAVTMHLRWLNM